MPSLILLISSSVSGSARAQLDGEAVAAGLDDALAAFGLRRFETVRHGIEHLGLGPIAHTVRGRLSEIPHDAFDHRLLSRDDAGDEGLAWAEIGAELHLGEIRGAGDEIARGEPQEDGGEREDQREPGDDVVAILGEEARRGNPAWCAPL